MIDVTLACWDTNSKVFDVVTVADADDEDSVDNSLLQISKLRFGQKAKLLFRLWAEGLVKILKLEVQAGFEAGQFLFWWSFLEVIKLNLGQDSEARFGQDFEAYVWQADFWLRFWSWFLVEIMKMKFDQDL